MSSPVLTITVRSRGSMLRASPSRSFDAPTPPASAVIFMSCVSRESVAHYGTMRILFPGHAQAGNHSLRAILRGERAADAIRGGPLGGNAADAADARAEFLRRDIFAECGARRFRDALFHQRAAEVVGSGAEAVERSVEPHLHPRHLQVGNRRA